MNVSGLNIGVEEVVNKKIRDEFPRILTMEQVEASKRSAKEYREAINQYSKKDYNINIDDLPPLDEPENKISQTIKKEFPRILTMEQAEASKRSAKEYREAINQYSKKDYNINIDDLPPLEKF